MEFIAIDVETANPDFESICQVGIVHFIDGKIVDQWSSFVDPEDEFDEVNVEIHGITSDSVTGAPTFEAIAHQLRALLSGRIVATHTSFDRVSISRSFEDCGLDPVDCTWLDTARVTRRAWPEFAASGYNLKNVCQHFGIQFQHHDAAEDARAAGEILLRAIADTGIQLEDWPKRVNQYTSTKVARDGNSDGPLAGQVLVFTGALSMPRKQASELAARAGCDVKDNVMKTTTLLVVGDQDIRKLSGNSKSSKHRKAEALIIGGQPIRIVGESDFVRLVEVG